MIDPALLDVTLPDPSGYPPELAALDSREAMMFAAADAGAVVTSFPDHLWIEPQDWPSVSAENDANRTWPLDYVDRFTNQGAGNGGYSTHECTCHALRCVFEAAWNRQRQIAAGPPVPGQRLDVSSKSASVWVSPLSIYAEANPGQWGGANCRQVLGIAAKRGFLPDKIQPREYGAVRQPSLKLAAAPAGAAAFASMIPRFARDEHAMTKHPLPFLASRSPRRPSNRFSHPTAFPAEVTIRLPLMPEDESADKGRQLVSRGAGYEQPGDQLEPSPSMFSLWDRFSIDRVRSSAAECAVPHGRCRCSRSR